MKGYLGFILSIQDGFSLLGLIFYKNILTHAFVAYECIYVKWICYNYYIYEGFEGLRAGGRGLFDFCVYVVS